MVCGFRTAPPLLLCQDHATSDGISNSGQAWMGIFIFSIARTDTGQERVPTGDSFVESRDKLALLAFGMGHPQGFRPPAHRHAHRLHSIPPRIKSTRALILDHMLWIHARTRFAQARAELAMSDPSGGPKSLNYPHRFRPELYDDDDNDVSDGDDDRQDLALAHSLRLRAESLERVINAMLDPTPPSCAGSHPHRLPNSVRLRLALGTVINDLLARHPTPSRVPTDLPPFPLFSSLVSPSPRVTGFYNSGADPHTANAPPSLRCPRHLHAACHICLHPISLSRHSPGLGSGLLRSRAANPLRRAVHRTTLSTLIPRFLRLSALVAAELGQEQSLSSPPPRPPSHDLGFFNALRPTRHWYFLLAGLLTRAVLEGYLTAGWRGFQPAQCLLLVGIATNSPADSDQGPFADLDPDGFPNLDQAIRVLFPSLMDDPLLPSPSTSQSRKPQEDTEYRSEMLQRLRRVSHDVPLIIPCFSWLLSSSVISQNPPQTCPLIWRTWRGLIQQSPSSALSSDSVKPSQDGEANQSSKQSVVVALFTRVRVLIPWPSTRRRSLRHRLECPLTPFYTRAHQPLGFLP